MSEALRHAPDALTELRDPATLRARCAAITRATGEGRSANFRLDRSRLGAVAGRVEAVTRAAYPDLHIPLHSRWRHFEAGGVDRKAELDALLAGRSTAEQARARIDLTLVSVLLDAGAGPQWRYQEAASASGAQGGVLARSEGLAVASFRAFVRGAFSSARDDPLRVDGAALQRLDEAALRQIFQVTAGNPLVGLEGRAALLQRLGKALQANAFRLGADARPGGLFDLLTAQGAAKTVVASDVLSTVLDAFSAIWLGGSVLHGVPLGDVWPHPWAGGSGTTAGWVPFHKLSQWLVYSLLEPFAWAGVEVTGAEALTGLPEYRNGGLFLDAGVIVARDPRLLPRTWKVGDEFIIEWRALTVTLLDELAPMLRERLGMTAAQLPLACVLQGGTWAAGRQIAQELRGGAPPLAIDSDGTIF